MGNWVLHGEWVFILRAFNTVLAVVAFFMIMYRLPEAIERVFSQKLFFGLVAYVPLAALGSVQGYLLHSPVGPVTLAVTVVDLYLIWVCWQWPKEVMAKSAPTRDG